MSQYCSRICIKVTSPQIWEKFRNTDDADFDLAELANTNKTTFLMEDCSYLEDELSGIVNALAETLKDDGIIIADTTNINVDPYDYCIFYLGDKVKEDFFYPEDDLDVDMFNETSIDDIIGWLNYGKFSVSKKEKETLSKFGIEVVNKCFVEIKYNYNFKLPKKILLRENSDEERVKNIEKITLDTKLFLANSKESNDPMGLEVMSDIGSIGYLPSDVSEKIAPMVINKKMKFNVKIMELVKLSERNKFAKSPIVAINIEKI